MKSLSPFSLPLILLPSHSLIFSIYLSPCLSCSLRLLFCCSCCCFDFSDATFTQLHQNVENFIAGIFNCKWRQPHSLRGVSLCPSPPIRHPPSLNPILLSFLLSLLAGPGQFPVQSALCMLSVSVSSPFIRSLLANLILYLPLFRSLSLSLLVLLHLHTA